MMCASPTPTPDALKPLSIIAEVSVGKKLIHAGQEYSLFWEGIKCIQNKIKQQQKM
jgi:hypothetical protein